MSGLPPIYLLTYEAVYLLRLSDYSGIKRRYLIFRDHTDPVPGPKKPLGEGAFRDLECHLALVAGVRWRNERIGAVLKIFGGQTFREALCCHVKSAEHRVASPPPHQADDVWVHLRHG